MSIIVLSNVNRNIIVWQLLDQMSFSSSISGANKWLKNNIKIFKGILGGAMCFCFHV